MKYIVGTVYSDYDEEVEVTTFEEWLTKTHKGFFLAGEDSDYFFYEDEILLEASADYKRGFNKSLIIISCAETGTAWGFVYTKNNWGDIDFEPFERYEQVPVTTYEWKRSKLILEEKIANVLDDLTDAKSSKMGSKAIEEMLVKLETILRS